MRLRLLHFNDLHGQLDRLPRLFTLIQRARAEAQAAGWHVLLLDGGDSSDPTAPECVATQGRASFVLLEAMGLQASVVGNNEAGRWGVGALEKIVAAVHFPMLAANLVDASQTSRLAVPGLKPSCLLGLDGFTLGLVGVTAVFPGLYEPFGYACVEPLPGLRHEVAALKDQGARTLILLSHLGCGLNAARRHASYSDEDAAADVPELDVIVGGHTHSELDPPRRVNGVVIAQAGDRGRFLGRLDLDLDDDSGRVRNFVGSLIPCDARVPPDPTISATLELVREEVARLPRP